jgi:hypothetical protein
LLPSKVKAVAREENRNRPALASDRELRLADEQSSVGAVRDDDIGNMQGFQQRFGHTPRRGMIVMLLAERAVVACEDEKWCALHDATCQNEAR